MFVMQAVEHLPSATLTYDEAHVPQDAQLVGDRRLAELDRGDDL